MSRIIVVLSCCLGWKAAGASQWLTGSCTEASPLSSTCCDVDEANNAKCEKNIRWAMQFGVVSHANWYEAYDVKNGSSFANFQCALFWINYNNAKLKKVGEDNVSEQHHSCPRPCAASVLNGCGSPPASLDPEFATTLAPATTFVPTVTLPPVMTLAPAMTVPPVIHFKALADKCLPEVPLTDCACGVSDDLIAIAGQCADPNSLECLALDCQTHQCQACHLSWIAVVLAFVALVAIAALVFLCNRGAKKKGGPEKKKKRKVLRNTHIPPPSEPLQHPIAPRPVSWTMQPAMETQYAHLPQQSTMMMSQPVQTTAMPQPLQTTSMSMAQYAAPAMDLHMMQYAAPAQQQAQMGQYVAAGTPGTPGTPGKRMR